MTELQMPTGPRLLVIGYGSTLRGDDGLGPRVAEEIEKLRLPGVRCLSPPLLTPELSDEIARAAAVVFVDATIKEKKVILRPVTASNSLQIFGHEATPPILLAFSRDLFGQSPKAWLLTIPAQQFELGEELSPRAARGIDQAIQKIRKLLNEL